MPQTTDIDLFQIDHAGIASFWLALKKTVGTSKNFKSILQEAEYSSDPFISYLMELAFGEIEELRVRILARAKADTMLADMGRRLNLMRICLLDMLNLENPHRTLAKMMAQYTVPPAPGAAILKQAQALMRAKPGHKDADLHFNIADRLPDDRLLAQLIFYNLLIRHKDKMALQEYVPLITSRFYRDGLALVIDGFEEPFVRRWLRVHKQTTLDDAAHKMQMCTELALGIRARYEYNDLQCIARSFL